MRYIVQVLLGVALMWVGVRFGRSWDARRTTLTAMLTAVSGSAVATAGIYILTRP